MELLPSVGVERAPESLYTQVVLLLLHLCVVVACCARCVMFLIAPWGNESIKYINNVTRVRILWYLRPSSSKSSRLFARLHQALSRDFNFHRRKTNNKLIFARVEATMWTVVMEWVKDVKDDAHRRNNNRVYRKHKAEKKKSTRRKSSGEKKISKDFLNLSEVALDKPQTLLISNPF